MGINMLNGHKILIQPYDCIADIDTGFLIDQITNSDLQV